MAKTDMESVLKGFISDAAKDLGGIVKGLVDGSLDLDSAIDALPIQRIEPEDGKQPEIDPNIKPEVNTEKEVKKTL